MAAALRVVIDNYPENQVENFECANHPQNPDMGTRDVPFSRVLYIERDDFMENPPSSSRTGTQSPPEKLLCHKI
jgi:glutaminyl-tRNA synthetase